MEDHNSFVASSVAEGATFFCIAAALYFSAIEFGDPDMPPMRPCRHIAAGLLLLIPDWLLFLSSYWLVRNPVLKAVLKVVAEAMNGTKFIVLFFCLRSEALTLSGLVLIAWLRLATYVHKPELGIFVFWPTAYHNASELILTVALLIGLRGTVYTRYLHDQRLACLAFGMPAVSFNMGNFSSDSWIKILSKPLVAVVLFYSYVMLQRRQRYLPPGLSGANFVRLGYLREAASRGERMRRCQELPEEAFGNPRKAVHLIVVSHRWLDPRTSDVCTDQFPQGLKMATLLERLEKHFWPSCGYSRSARIIGGWDVLVFIDFMCLPQQGLDAQGIAVSRAPSEAAIFDECLPRMGTLYSMFPVLILTEVPQGEGYHAYHESGWCTCEFIIATLGKQLHDFSTLSLPSSDLGTLLTASLADFDSTVASRFVGAADDYLQNTRFTNETDRLVVHGIIRRFVVKRTCADYVRRGDVSEVRKLLLELSDEDLCSILEEPVNAKLDTLLHLAVRARQRTICEELLKLGARTNLRNLYGDLPSQWYCFPRVDRAAAAVRAWGRSQGRQKAPTSLPSQSHLTAVNSLAMDASAGQLSAAVDCSRLEDPHLEEPVPEEPVPMCPIVNQVRETRISI